MSLFSARRSRGKTAATETAPIPRSSTAFEVSRTVQSEWYGDDFNLSHSVQFCGKIAANSFREGLRQLALPAKGPEPRHPLLKDHGPFNLSDKVYTYPFLKHTILYKDDTRAALEYFKECNKGMDPAYTARLMCHEIQDIMGEHNPIKIPLASLNGIKIEPGETVSRLSIGIDPDFDDPHVERLAQVASQCRDIVYEFTGFDVLPRSPSIAIGEMPQILLANPGTDTIEIDFGACREDLAKANHQFDQQVADLNDRSVHDGYRSVSGALLEFINHRVEASNPQLVGSITLRPTQIH